MTSAPCNVDDVDKDDMTTDPPAPSEPSEAGEPLYERHTKTLDRVALRRLVGVFKDEYPEETAHLRPQTRGDCFKWRITCTTCGGSEEARASCHHCYGSGLEFMRLSVNGQEFEERDEYRVWLAAREQGTTPLPELRACLFVSCVHHLYLDVSKNEDSLNLFHPDKEPEELKTSCSLDVADDGAITLEAVADMLNVTRERVRQIEWKTVKQLRRLPVIQQMHEDGYTTTSVVDDRLLWASNDGGKAEPPKPVDPDQEWIDNVWRIYERMSREKALGLRPEFDVQPKKAAKIEELAPVVEAAPEPPEEPRERLMPPKEPLTERQQVVLDAYLQCVRVVGGRPRPMDVALATGIELRKGAEAAMVNNALVAAIEKGYEVPYYDQPLPPLQKTPTPPRVPERIVQEKTPMQKAVAKKRVRTPAKKRVRTPRKPVVYGDGMTPGAKEKDDFVKALLKKKEELMAELMAINLLLDRA